MKQFVFLVGLMLMMYCPCEVLGQDTDTTALELLESAKNGNADSQYNLGKAYENGEGVEQNYAKAVNWYRKAAYQGDANGQIALANMYYNGHGVQQDV